MDHSKASQLTIMWPLLDMFDYDFHILFFFLRLLEDTLNFMTKTAQHGEHASQDATGKFWKALLHKTYEIVDKVSKSCKVSARYL